MKLVVGLGNPGSKYESTRHNIGFLAADVLAKRWGVSISTAGFRGLYGKTILDSEKVLLVKPQTFMNDSGDCVGAMARYFDIAPEDVIVIYDDFDLPLGRLRIRKSGSAGTHNGMKSLVAHLDTQAFPRVRIGMGHPAPGEDIINFVLATPSKADRAVLAQVLEAAADAVEMMVTGDVDGAMRKANTFDALGPAPEGE